MIPHWDPQPAAGVPRYRVQLVFFDVVAPSGYLEERLPELERRSRDQLSHSQELLTSLYARPWWRVRTALTPAEAWRRTCPRETLSQPPRRPERAHRPPEPKDIDGAAERRAAASQPGGALLRFRRPQRSDPSISAGDTSTATVDMSTLWLRWRLPRAFDAVPSSPQGMEDLGAATPAYASCPVGTHPGWGPRKTLNDDRTATGRRTMVRLAGGHSCSAKEIAL